MTFVIRFPTHLRDHGNWLPSQFGFHGNRSSIKSGCHGNWSPTQSRDHKKSQNCNLKKFGTFLEFFIDLLLISMANFIGRVIFTISVTLPLMMTPNFCCFILHQKKDKLWKFAGLIWKLIELAVIVQSVMISGQMGQ